MPPQLKAADERQRRQQAVVVEATSCLLAQVRVEQEEGAALALAMSSVSDFTLRIGPSDFTLLVSARRRERAPAPRGAERADCADHASPTTRPSEARSSAYTPKVNPPQQCPTHSPPCSP